MADLRWGYERLDDSGNVERCPVNDTKGEVTGKIIIGLKEYFDENPEERIRLGWIKHIYRFPKDVEYNTQTQYLEKSYRQIDDYTIEDVYHVIDKTEEMMLLEELLDAVGYIGSSFTFYGMEEP